MAQRELERREVLAAVVGGTCASLLGCAGPHTMVPIAPQRPDLQELDRDPISLLPPDILVFLNVDLSALYPSALGGDVAAMIQSFVPLGPESGFSAPRDTTRVMGGVYVFQGLDFCAVVQGRFDPAALRAAADGRAAQPAQQPLVKSRYGGFDVYTVSNVGFVPLTARTLLVGNETGLRRALDRLRYGKLERRVPAWMTALGAANKLPIAIAGDFGADAAFLGAPAGRRRPPRATSTPAAPILRASAAEFPFLGDLRILRVLGNFAAPGLNLAGSLTYSGPDQAKKGADGLRSVAQLAQWAGMFSVGGLPPIKVAVSGHDVGFVQPIDAGFARTALQMLK